LQEKYNRPPGGDKLDNRLSLVSFVRIALQANEEAVGCLPEG
jgi:hypothetical protein